MYIETEGVNLAALGPGSRLLSEGYRTLFYQELDEAVSMFDKIFEVRDSKKRSEFDMEFAGLTMAQETPIASPTAFQYPMDGGTKKIDMVRFTNGFQVAEEDRDDDLYGALAKVGADLPKTFTRRVESLCAGYFAGMFSTSLGFDGLPIVSLAHPFLPGYQNVTTNATTWTNRLAVDSALSPESLHSLHILLRQTRTREGFPAGLKGKVLVLPVELEGRGAEILTSMYKAYTDTNERNILTEGGIYPTQSLTWEWLPSATSYALLDPDKSPFYFYWRQRPLFRSQTALNAGIDEYYGKMRCAPGSSEPRGIAATPGA